MIKTLEVKNFKSIKDLRLDCRKVNVFIGKPNTGKSNILESIGIFSFPYASGSLRSLVRFESMIDLFYDHDLAEKIQIIADDMFCQIHYENLKFFGQAKKANEPSQLFGFEFDYTGRGSPSFSQIPSLIPFKFYRFGVQIEFPRREPGSLLPPGGENLLQTLLVNKALRKFVSDILIEYGLRIVLKPLENKIEVQKQVEDIVFDFPYSLVSDTLQRIVFHLTAIETNRDATIIFEEPEAHAFPFYTKFLAERIALDRTNQYFISTHNPYFLLSILEKTPQTDIGIFITYLEGYQTKVKSLTVEDFREILDMDCSVFFNLDKFLEEK